MKKFFSSRIFTFLMGGGLAAALNLILIYFLIEELGLNSAYLRNLANAISIEFSLIASFFIYRIWVWTGGSWRLQDLFFKQLPLYHVSAGLALLLRVFVIFPILDWLGVDYLINTLIGVTASAAINYVISDNLVSESPTLTLPHDELATPKREKLYPPEGLEPALTKESNLKCMDRGYGSIRMLSVVIPAYNEEDCIASTVNSISDTLTGEGINYEILVVNDNSKDDTEGLLKELSDRNQHVRYINSHYPNGFGFAVRCGLENFRGDAVTIVMADGSDSPTDIVRYYYTLREGYDCIFGSRFIKGGKVIDYPSHKLIVNRLANLFIQIIFGLRFNDTTNAFKIYRREVIEGISPLISHHFNLTVEIPLKAVIRGYRYRPIAISWRNRQTGVSKLKIKEMGSRYLFIVLYIWLEKHLSRGDYHRNNCKQVAKINN